MFSADWFASKRSSTTERRPENVASSFTVASSNDAARDPNAARTPSDMSPISLSLRSSPARTPQSIARTGPEPVARSGARVSASTASVAREGPCMVTAANLPRPALARRWRILSASSLR